MTSVPLILAFVPHQMCLLQNKNGFATSLMNSMPGVFTMVYADVSAHLLIGFITFNFKQWSKCPQIAFAVYRVVLALYVTGFLLGVIVISVQHQGAESFIYLTTYGFIIFAAYNTVAAFNVILDGCIRRHNPSQGETCEEEEILIFKHYFTSCIFWL